MERKPNFIHFVLDEKFLPDSIKCFDKAGLTNNRYYLISKTTNLTFLEKYNIEIVSADQALKIIQDANNIDVICLHSLYSIPFSLIPRINEKVKVIWYLWGFDIYSNSFPLRPLVPIKGRYAKETSTYLAKDRLLDVINKKVYYALSTIKHFKTPQSRLLEAVKRIDYFAGVFPSEHNLLKDYVKEYQAELTIHNYIHPHEFRLEDINEPVKISGHNILLGNSASLLGNHLDIMNQISKYVGRNDKIICPLSYAGTAEYKQAVIDKGKKLFGERFIALTEYLPLEEYTRVMQSCNRFVMGMKQQAATCNCLTSMWDGIKVYVPKDSENYRYYNSIGLKVYSIEEDFGRDTDDEYTHLENNRKIIENLYSYRAWCEDLKNCIDQLHL